MNVLIVEDERSLAIEMEAFLNKACYVCVHVRDAASASESIGVNSYDFILLDLGLPDRDGLEVLKDCRKYNPEAAVIILTARGDLEDRIKGLELGADDYLAKPFSLLELQARMQAISRRKFQLADDTMPIGDFKVDLGKRLVYFGDTEINLSRKEFDIFSYLIMHRNKPLSRIQLYEHVWGDFAADESDSNYIDVHIKNIRKKLGEFAEVTWLETIRGIGYKIRSAQ
ncbi:response regulator transcription factor [Parapedobacter sp. GCM10030251]|uniref:response regulator transcription factor n=1 Tax=Parapedobacter sp. GCM10030251 TaxID=3273419 RepID=UPI0036173C89